MMKFSLIGSARSSRAGRREKVPVKFSGFISTQGLTRRRFCASMFSWTKPIWRLPSATLISSPILTR